MRQVKIVCFFFFFFFFFFVVVFFLFVCLFVCCCFFIAVLSCEHCGPWASGSHYGSRYLMLVWKRKKNGIQNGAHILSECNCTKCKERFRKSVLIIEFQFKKCIKQFVYFLTSVTHDLSIYAYFVSEKQNR